MFGGKTKVTCSNKIAEKSLDVFANVKAQISDGIAEIKVNREQRITLRENLQTALNEVCTEIDKDDENIRILQSKLESVDNLI